LLAAVGQALALSVHGLAGVGKTALAQAVRSFQPDVKPPESLDELAGLYRSALAGRRALVFLDNARDLEHVQALLPPADAEELLRKIAPRAARAATSDTAARLCADYPNLGLGCLKLRLSPDEQAVWLEAALAAARRLGDRAGEGIILTNLGGAYLNLEELSRAQEYFEQALAIDRELGDRLAEAQDLSNLATVLEAQGDSRAAIERQEQALATIRELGERRELSTPLSNLGGSYAALGEMPKARECFEQALAIAREAGDRDMEGTALKQLGRTLAELGETDPAITLASQSLKIADELGDAVRTVALLYDLGEYHETLGDLRRSIAYFVDCAAGARRLGQDGVEELDAHIAELQAQLDA
jgi:tetratricopeptide (TPR) repeat protein